MAGQWLRKAWPSLPQVRIFNSIRACSPCVLFELSEVLESPHCPCRGETFLLTVIAIPDLTTLPQGPAPCQFFQRPSLSLPELPPTLSPTTTASLCLLADTHFWFLTTEPSCCPAFGLTLAQLQPELGHLVGFAARYERRRDLFPAFLLLLPYICQFSSQALFW